MSQQQYQQAGGASSLPPGYSQQSNFSQGPNQVSSQVSGAQPGDDQYLIKY